MVTKRIPGRPLRRYQRTTVEPSRAPCRLRLSSELSARTGSRTGPQPGLPDLYRIFPDSSQIQVPRENPENIRNNGKNWRPERPGRTQGNSRKAAGSAKIDLHFSYGLPKGSPKVSEIQQKLKKVRTDKPLLNCSPWKVNFY